MLPKLHRLHQDQEIKSLTRAGQTFFLPQFIFKYQKNQEKISKFAFVVSTKVDKRAVARNLLKRRMRAVVKDLLPNLATGFSVLIIAKKQALELDFQAITKQFIFAFTKSKLYVNRPK
ncbi:MAG: Ribonuclease P protein component [Parcubacteria group bacterium GW2011_GWA2_36_10]|nr:MAG: Ribonuclease P protein component [Parcubacteria group bacterium GW2011_GWA2_36_10]